MMDRFKRIKNTPCFSAALEGLKKKYTKLTAAGLVQITDELFNIFYKTGSRTEYENVYFTRRGILTVSSLLYFIYNDEKYYNTMLEIMQSICDEKTWALPAHVPEDCESPECVIDLFNAETAQTLAEICSVCGGDIPVELHDRIHYEINRRITVPFIENRQHWENADHNWAAVCGGSVGMALLYEFPEVFGNVEDRIVSAMNSYLNGFGDDGICSEGLGYWKYGFMYFTAFAELYKEKCGIDLLSGEKIKRIAQCQQWLMMEKNISVSFSDCARNEAFDLSIAHFYRRIYGDDILIIDNTVTDGMDNCNRYLGASRSLLWIDTDIESCDKVQSEKYFKDIKWYINRRNGFSFAAKAGHNAESHNHNDIGSFIVSTKNGQMLADYGAGEYTREYFSDKRYDIICNSSLGHSVPVIDGSVQSAGREFKGDVLKHSDNVFSIEFSDGYKHENLIKLVRNFEISDVCIKISDFYTFNDNKPHNITERFVSVIKPEMRGSSVAVGDSVLKSEHTPKITQQQLNDHNGKADMLYFIDYENISDSFELCIMI